MKDLIVLVEPRDATPFMKLHRATTARVLMVDDGSMLDHEQGAEVARVARVLFDWIARNVDVAERETLAAEVMRALGAP